MGPDLELKGRSEIVIEASGNKETADVMKKPEDKHMRCASNYEDNTFEMEALMDEQTEITDGSRDVEVNILECTNSGDIGLVEDEYQDATENSSSFDNTVSGLENGKALSDAEVESELHGKAMRKKRVTPHWRTYIRPLMWRCKWVELQIKKFQSQAIKYDRELAEYNRRKQIALENCVLEGFGAISLPFSGQRQRKEIMKRKKRKRVEDTLDIASYMSHHNLFSYYDNKRSAADAAFMDDEWGNQVICAMNGNNQIGVNDELLSLEFRDGDNSLEEILLKIRIVESQVSKMKTRLHKLMSENAGKFSPTDKLSLLAPCNALSGPARNPASSHNNGYRMPVGSSYIATQLIPECNMGDLVTPESAASSHGEANHVPDKIKSTDQREVGGSSKNIGKGILMYNRRAKEELNPLKGVNTQLIEKPRVPKEEQDSSVLPFHVLEPDLPTDDQPTPKIRSISKITAMKNKRKRGRRKAGSGRWSG